MLVKIPRSKKIVAAANAQGIWTGAWEASSTDPAKPADGVPFDFEFVRHFVGQTLLSDPSWGKDMASVYQAEEIRGAFRGKKAGQIADLPKAHWDRLVGVMKNPASPYNVLLMGLALDFFAAIEHAAEKPEKP